MATKLYSKGAFIAVDQGAGINYIPANSFDFGFAGSNTAINLVDLSQKNHITYSDVITNIQNEAGAAVGDKAAIITYISLFSSDVVAKNYWVEHAKRMILSDYGDNVSVEAKKKNLLKFGRNKLVGTTKATLMTLPVGITNETYVSTNAITTISSSSASDTTSITIEGHTISGGLFTFVTQTITLTGQTQKTLTTALARVSRVVAAGSVDLIGNIYVYETDTSTAGVPDTDVKVHIILEAGLNNSEKCATTVSNTDYWLITGFYADVLEKVSAFGTIHLEVRLAGKVFINKVDISASSTGSRGIHKFEPYLIVPKNADVRLRGTSNTAGVDISGGIEGVLAGVI